MKTIKKMMALVIAMVMVLGMSTMAMAAGETYKVTIPSGNDLGHDANYVAYQIFTGTQESDGGPLGDIAYGNGFSLTTFITEVAQNPTLASDFASVTATTKAYDLSEIMATCTGDAAIQLARVIEKSTTGEGFALAAGSTTDLPTGYYLIKDTTTIGSDDVLNASLLQLTSDVTIQKKTDKPSSEKKVTENKKTVTGGTSAVTGQAYGEKVNDVADYSIGDYVPFQLASKVPDMTYYRNYHITFTDKMDNGLTFVNDATHALTVKIGSTTLESTAYELDTNSTTNGGKTFTLKINLKTTDATTGAVTQYTAGDAIYVDFYGQLNSDAVIGLDGNVNESSMKYSNNPNQDNGGDEGETPVDKVIVFTYELDNTKVDAETTTKTLKDAEFVMYRLNGTTKEYVQFDSNNKVTGWVAIADPTGEYNIQTYYTNKGASKLTSDAQGKFNVIGLDDDTYYILETKAPAGYNLPTTPFTSVLKATTVNNQNWNMTPSSALTKLELNNVEQDTTNHGVAAQNITNTKGSTLPETGGVGTTMFYIIGAILVIGAGILLVSKRRMSAN